MEFVNDPIKSKKVFILMLILTIVFFLAGSALGYFYYRNYQQIKSLKSDKANLETQLANAEKDLQKQLADLKKINDELKSENETLTTQAEQNKAKSNKISAYIAVLSYAADVIEVHNGFTGWTDAEYQHARSLAQKTGDQNFVTTVDWAWNRTDISQVTRFVGFLRAIVNGVNANLWK